MELRQAVAQYDYSELAGEPRMALTVDQLEALVNELVAYHQLYSPYFRDERQAAWSYHYLCGLLDPTIARKSAENIALETVGSEGVRPLQHFLGESRWSEQALIAEHRRQSGLTLGQENGILIVDGSDIPKQGEHSVGVQRQWCGELGKIANCQAGVFLGYSSRAGYTLLDKRLYLPEVWFSQGYASKRYKARVPSDVTFQTKNQLAWQMIEELVAADTLPFRWITMDEAFGHDSQLLDRIDQETDAFYLAEVPKSTRLWLESPDTYLPQPTGRGRPGSRLRLAAGAPAAQSVAELAGQLPASAWKMHALRQASKGLLIAEMAFVRVYPSRNGLPGDPVWLVIRRHPDDPTELHYFLSNAPASMATEELLFVCSMRWPIEIIFEQAKQLLGLNEYETRSWLGWHHHMALVILAFGFLARTQAIFRTEAPALTLPQVVDLLKAVLPKPNFDAQAALKRLLYKQKRIASAKRSHYNMQKKRLDEAFLVAQ